jgi:hypothetical protein
MLAKEYKLVFEFLKEDGTRLGQVSVEIDWEPAREWTRFLGIRRGLLPPSEPSHSTAIEPLWNRRSGEPYLQGFRVTISGSSFSVVSEDFTNTYFHGLAREASGHFVERGTLKQGERFQYLAAAYPNNAGSTSKEESRFELEEVEPEIPYHAKSLTASMEGALLEGVVDAGDMPVFIPQQVLDEAEAITLSARGIETAGILIGHLSRDESLPEIFAEITAQIPARATGGTAKLSFNAETWTAVRAAMDIRRKNELYLGFWHSHPVQEWCKNNDCSEEKQLSCPLAKGFFSQDDQALLRTVFPRAYSVGLVCSDLPLGQPSFSLFGWRRGMIESRGFHIRAAKLKKTAQKPGKT